MTKKKPASTTRTRTKNRARPRTIHARSPAKKQSRSNQAAQRSQRRPAHALEIDWSQFDNGRNADRFEDLAVDLFATQFGEAQFTPNARRSGRDGGVDGFFDGSIGRVPGPWKVAVAVRQTLAEAKKKVRHESQLARDAGQRALFFITSFDATAVQTQELTALAKKGLRGAQVWSRAKLDRLLRDHTWLRQVYFGHQLVPGFVPVGHPCELDDPSQPDIELVGRLTEREELRRFIAGEYRIALLIADGGSGKTRLLRALPDVLWGTAPRRSVWLRRPGQGTIDEAFLSGLPARKPLAFVLDDGAQALPEMLELARLAVDQTLVNAKLIVSVRSVDREAALRELARFRRMLVEIEVGELAAVDGARIVTIECPSIGASDATRIAQAFGSNLFLLRAAAQQLSAGEQPSSVVDDEHIRRLVATRMIDEAERHLASVADRRETLAALSETSLNAPLPFETTEQSLVLAALYHARFLRRVGDTLRFRRDVEGDLLLAYLLEQPAQRALIERVFAGTATDDLQRPLRNLSAAGRGYATTMIRALVQRWISARATLMQGQTQLLPYCAEAAPVEVAEICVENAGANGMTASDIASVVSALGRTDAVRGLRLLWQLALLDVSAAPFSSHNIINRLLNPWFHGPEELDAACRLLDEWTRDALGGRRVEVLSDAVGMLFTTVASWDTNDGATFTMHERELPAAPRLLAVRRAATSLLGAMLCHDNRDVRLRGVHLLGRHGAPHMGRVSTQAFNTSATTEFQSLTIILENRLSIDDDTQVLASLWMSLATRWATGRPGADAAAQLLLGRTIAPIINAFRYGSRNEWFYSFDEAFAAAPNEGRWTWWVHQYLHNRSDAECARVVRDLCARYRTAEEVARCISDLALADRPEWLINEWCRQQPTLFAASLRFIAHAGARAHVENAIRRHTYETDQRRVLADLRALPQPAALDAVNIILNNSTRDNVSLAVDVGRYLVEQPDVNVRRRGLDCVQHRDDADAGAVLEILERALRDGDWGRHWDVILYVLQKPDRCALLPQRASLTQLIEERFLEGKEFIGDEWHEERVLELLYGESDARRLDLLGRLLARGTFGAVQEVARLVAPLAIDRDRFGTLAERSVLWARELGERALDTIESIFEAALGDLEPPEGAQARAIEMLRNDDAAMRGVGLVLLALHQAVPEACALIAQLAADETDALRERAVSALWSLRWPRGGWSRSVGEPPAKLTALQDALRRAQALVTGEARRLVTEVLRAVDQAIADFAREDEEVLVPR